MSERQTRPVHTARIKANFIVLVLAAVALWAVGPTLATAQGQAATDPPGHGFLPHNRAWEMVSPPDKNGAGVLIQSLRTRAAVDGDAVQYASLSAFGDAMGTGVAVDFMAQRGSQRWTTHALTPAQDPPLNNTATIMDTDALYQGDMAPDLSAGVFRSYAPLPGTHGSVADAVNNLYLRQDLLVPGQGNYELLSICPRCAETGNDLVPVPDKLNLAGASNDFEHIAFDSGPGGFAFGFPSNHLTSDASPANFNAFEWTRDGRDETQQLTVSATDGEFNLTFDGAVTPDLPFDATAPQVETALNSLSSIGGLSPAGAVSVSGTGGGGPFYITFGGALARTDVSPIVAGDGATPLSGGSGASISTTVNGGNLQLTGRVPDSGSACNDRVGPSCVVPPGGSAVGGGSSAQGTSNAGGGASTTYQPAAVSDDGTRIVFNSSVTSNSGTTTGASDLYMRINGERTIQVNASENPAPQTPARAEYYASSNDGRKVFFITTEQLLADDDNAVRDVYMWDSEKPEGNRLTLISKDQEPGDATGAGAREILGVSDDGDDVYFYYQSQIVPGGPPLGSTGALFAGIFHWQDGEPTRFVTGVSQRTQNGLNYPGQRWNLIQWEHHRVTPDGEHLLFAADATPADGPNGQACGTDPRGSGSANASAGRPCRMLYLYDAHDGDIQCVSCLPSGLDPTGAAENAVFLDQTPRTANIESQALSDDGRYVFFNSPDRLVPEDKNSPCEPATSSNSDANCVDVYVYDSESRSVALISSGEGTEPAFFMDASVDGEDVFFITTDRLSKWDVDERYDLYDARVNGGLPEPRTEAEPCSDSAACQGTSGGGAVDEMPGSAAAGTGNPAVEASSSCAAPRKRLAGAKRKLKRARGSKADRLRLKKIVKRAKRNLRRCREADQSSRSRASELSKCASPTKRLAKAERQLRRASSQSKRPRMKQAAKQAKRDLRRCKRGES